MPTQADVLIVTVTPVESKAVLRAFAEATGQKAKTETIDQRVYRHLGEINGARVLLGQSGMGAGSLGGSLQAITRSIEALKPAAVVMVGIAFGVNEEKQAIGDVLISEHLRLYDLQRVGTPDVILRGSRPDASPWLLSYLKSAELDWDEEKAKIRFGLVLTGDKLVDNVDYRDGLIAFEPEAIGGEMEGAGLYAACHDAKVDWILVKGICDWADGDKEHEKAPRQQQAAKNAAEFVLLALQHAPLDDFSARADEFPPPESEKAPSAGPVTINGNANAVGNNNTIAHGERAIAAAQGSNVAGGNIIGSIIYGTAPPNHEIRSSLPTQQFFFGREQELRTLAAAIAPAVRSWGALIDGPGGIGKTALAIKAAHDAPVEQFPLKLFLTAKRRELKPSGPIELHDFALREYDDVLKELARELKAENLEALPPEKRADAVRLALTDKHALLVIDNVEAFPEAERERLYQFLSMLPPGCKAIVTSRRRTDIDARVIRLSRLEEGEALKLIAALAEMRPLLARASDAERRRLYEVSNGNPLLLHWLAGQLGRVGSHCRTVAQACAFLASAPANNDPLEFIFGDLLDTFTPNETAVLAALTHFTQPAQVSWLAEALHIFSFLHIFSAVIWNVAHFLNESGVKAPPDFTIGFTQIVTKRRACPYHKSSNVLRSSCCLLNF